MKIVDVKTVVVGNVPPYHGGHFWLFVKLITDKGITGLGERPTYPVTRVGMYVSLIEDLAQEFVLGADPFDIESLWQRMYAVRHDLRHPSLSYTPAMEIGGTSTKKGLTRWSGPLSFQYQACPRATSRWASVASARA